MKDQRFILTLSCPDKIGIVAKISAFLAENGGFILESSQYSDTLARRFFMRIVFSFQNRLPSESEFARLFEPLARSLQLEWNLQNQEKKSRALILVSGYGHCLNDLLHRTRSGSLPLDVPAIASNHETLQEMASWYKIPFYHLPITPKTKQTQEAEILKLCQNLQIDLVILARYMQILSPELCKELSGKAINIHHSFLPSFKGAKPYQQAFERGVKLIGATAHYVSEELDEGPIIEQETLRVDHAATPEQLSELGKDIEAQVLARAIKYHTERRVFLAGRKTVVFR